MKLLSVFVLFVTSLTALGQADPNRNSFAPVAPEVQAYMKRRDECDKLRLKPKRTLSKKQKKAMAKLCKGSDKELARLREKFKDDAAVINDLKDYDSKIEK